MEGASILLEDNTEGVGTLITEDNFTIVNDLGSNGSLATEEDIRIPIRSFKRLCGAGLHDLILEEEAILQEQADLIQLEDFTVSLDNVTQEDTIFGEFVPFIGFEPHGSATDFEAAVSIDDNVLMESATHRTENHCIVTEDTGHLIGREEDETSHIVLDDFYFKYYSQGIITQAATVISITGSTFPSAVVNGGRFYYQNGIESTVIVAVSDNGLELTVENSTTISSAENYKIEYGLDETAANAPEAIVMEAFTLDTLVDIVSPKLIFNGVGDVNHGFTRGENTDGFGTLTLTIPSFADIIGNDMLFEDSTRILVEDSIGGFIAFEDSQRNVELDIAHSKVLNESEGDDVGGFIATEDYFLIRSNTNVLMREINDGILLEDSETEKINFVLTEDDGQVMLEEVFQISEGRIVLNSSDSVLIEDQPDGENFNYRLLNLDMGRFDIETVANNTSMTIQSTDSSTSGTDYFKRSDSSILVSRTEQIV
jgi:hypothetical protein